MSASPLEIPTPAPDGGPGAPQEAVESVLARAHSASGPERASLHGDAIVSQVPLARAVAARYRDRGEPYEDLVQVACLALVKAVHRYRPGHGVSFAAYAVPTITGELRRYFRDHAWAVRPPRRVQELRPRVGDAQQEMVQELHRAPTPAELAARLGVSCRDVVETQAASAQYRCLSLDAPQGGEEDEGLPVREALGGADPHLERVVEHAGLAPLLDRLSARERRILCLRFYAGLTQRQIAEDIGVTQMQVSRLLSQALGRLRTMVAALPEAADPVEAPLHG